MGFKINYNTKHLRKGDPLPPFTGKVRVYNMRYCPFAQRAILALNAKKIDYEVVNIDLSSKPEWLSTKSAFDKVPAVEIEENISICESSIAVEFVDDYFPQRRLQSKDPTTKALDKIIVETQSTLLPIFLKAVKTPEAVTDDVVAPYYKGLDFIQDQLKHRGTDFLGGSEPGYADYMIWPWFERIFALDGVNGKMVISPDKYALLLQYLNRLAEDPAVKDYLMPEGTFKKFFNMYIKGERFSYDTLQPI